ncbi:bacteriohemerythrin [Thalassotalea profundi]|uniref:Bacteriohemerythrin n=1 Tax=Thalassotalea profundi TaxID=2036687 RepID=A0ABQ3IMZ4_9GAMM|nr:bacteriohemerythrin [Thalassotalea profundi]GHE88353.1 bacteriohemerythrin [Thalassotalea profundi]
MPLIKWDDATLSVGIESIDNQHKIIIECINELSINIKENKSLILLEKQFDKLISYTKYHFANEEPYFKHLNEKDILLHQLQHKHFIEQLYLYKDEALEHISQDVLDSLLDWFIAHIQCEDMKLMSKKSTKDI